MKKLKLALVSLILLSTLMLSLGVPSVRGVIQTNEKVLVVDTIGEPMDIDPAWSYDTASAELLMNVYETLLWFNRTESAEYIPILATEWHWVDGSGKYYDDELEEYVITADSPEHYTWAGRWEFTIRTTGPKFHDDLKLPKHSWEGASVTTADVEYTFERELVTDCSTGPAWMLWDPTFGASWAGDVDAFLTYEGFPVNEETGWNTKVDEAIDHCVESNATHVWFNLILAYPPFLQIVAQQWGSILSKAWCTDVTIPGHQYEWPGMQVGDAWADYTDPAKSPLYYVSTASPGLHLDAALGTGPYMLNYWDTGAGGSWSVVKNTAYWRGWDNFDGLHPKHVDEFQSWYIPEWSTRRLRFLGGISDFCAVPRMYMTEVLGAEGIDCMWPLQNLACDGAFFTFLVSATSTRMGSGPLVNATLTTGWSSTNSPVNIFNFSDVRLAFAHAFNYTEYLAAAMLNEAVSPTTPILDILAPNVPQPGQAENPSISQKKKYGITSELADPTIGNTNAYNLTLAAKYLKKVSGLWANGFTMDFLYNEGNLVRETAARVLKKGFDWITANIAGAPTFTITVSMIPWSVYKLEWKAYNLPYFIVGWLADYPDAHNFAHPFMHSVGAFSRWQGFMGITEFPTQAIDDEIALGISDAGNRAVHYDWLNHEYVDMAPSFVLQVPTGRHFQRNWVDTGVAGPAIGTYDPLSAPLWTKGAEGRWVYNPIYPGEYVYDLYKDVEPQIIKECDVAITVFVKTQDFPVPGYAAMINRSEEVRMYDHVYCDVTVKRLDAAGFITDFIVRVKKIDKTTAVETLIEDPVWVTLAGGQEQPLEFLWNETNDIGDVYILKAEVLLPVPYVIDTNRANNYLYDPDTQAVWWPDCNGLVDGKFCTWPSLGDGIIEGKDLSALMKAWGEGSDILTPLIHEVCDFNADTIVEGKDLKVLMKYWYAPVNKWPPGPD